MVAQYVVMFAAPFAAVTREVYAIEDVDRPPCVYAWQSPNAAGHVASGPTGVAEGTGVAVSVTAVAVSVTEVVGAGAPIRLCALCCNGAGKLPVYAAAAVPPTAIVPTANAPIAILLPIKIVKNDI